MALPSAFAARFGAMKAAAITAVLPCLCRCAAAVGAPRAGPGALPPLPGDSSCQSQLPRWSMPKSGSRPAAACRRNIAPRWRWSTSNAMPKPARGWTELAGGARSARCVVPHRAVRPGRQCLAAGGRWRQGGAKFFRRADVVGRRSRPVRRSGAGPGDAQELA